MNMGRLQEKERYQGTESRCSLSVSICSQYMYILINLRFQIFRHGHYLYAYLIRSPIQVGGEFSNTVITKHMKEFGRVAIRGCISGYNATDTPNRSMLYHIL